MVRILVFIILAASSISSAAAQTQIDIGVKGGLNVANLITKPLDGETYDPRVSYHAGAFILFKRAKFGIQPEFIFSQQGSKFSRQNATFYNQGVMYSGAPLHLDLNYTYINIPVMFKFYHNNGFNLQLG